MRQLSVPERHQLKIARATLEMSDVGAMIMGGPNKEEARAIILKLTGKPASEDDGGDDSDDPTSVDYQR